MYGTVKKKLCKAVRVKFMIYDFSSGKNAREVGISTQYQIFSNVRKGIIKVQHAQM